jgi:hypothetical protein
MTLFEYINDNIERIKFDVKIGIIPCTLIKHYQIYRMYSIYRCQNMSVNNAVFNVCEAFSVDKSWVFIIIKKMQTEI